MLKLQFFQPLTWLTLGILAGTSISPLVLAHPAQAYDSKLSAWTQSQEDGTVNSGSYSGRQRVAQRRQQDEQAGLLLQAQSLYDQGKFTDAEAIYRKILEKERDNAVMHYQLGNVLYRQDKLEEAATEYQQVLKLNPKYAVARNAIGAIRARQGNWEQAIAEFKQALSINPDYADALHNLGRALWQQGNGTEAVVPLEKAKNLFKQQLRFEEVRQIDEVLQQIAKKKIEA